MGADARGKRSGNYANTNARARFAPFRFCFPNVAETRGFSNLMAQGAVARRTTKRGRVAVAL